MPAARRLLYPVIAASLCTAMAVPPELAAERAAASAKKQTKRHSTAQLSQEQKALHALNRLTFGPRPGELANVQAIGLEAWFQQQLHPERIPDDAFGGRLAQFPAMQLPQEQLVERYPTPAMLKRYLKGGLASPDDEAERAIYADAAFRYQEKVEAKQAARQTAVETTAVSASGVSAETGQGVPTSEGGAAPIVRTGPGSVGTVPVATEAQVALPPVLKKAVLDLAPAYRMQRLLSMSPEQMAAFQNTLKGPEQARLLQGLTPEQVEQAEAMRSPERLIDAEVLSTRLLRDVYSQRQLQAVMTDFWLNHFSVYLRKNQNEPYLLPAYERDAILPHALGRFEDLLVATAKSPAMLVYLDNWESVGPNSRAAGRAAAVQPNRPVLPSAKGGAKMPKGINENYARELMELHTLGVKGGYTQTDVIEVAKCFTGWTIDRPGEGGQFLFNPSRHEPGQKVVMGTVIPEGGMDEGLEVLHLLATSPATARFVSLKLAERFVSDAPPQSLVDRMAATFLKSDGDLKAVMTTMFHSPEFWSPAVYRAKVKTPLEFAASALRASNANVTHPVPLVQAMDRLGMPLYGMQTPNGYSWKADAWVSSNALLTRMNFALVLSGNRLGGTEVNWPALLGGAADVARLPDTEAERRLELALLGQPAAPQTERAALEEAQAPDVQRQAELSFRATPVRSETAAARPAEARGSMLRIKAARSPAVQSGPETPLATMAGLLLGSPDFQRR